MKFEVKVQWRGSYSKDTLIETGVYELDTFPYPEAAQVMLRKGYAVLIDEPVQAPVIEEEVPQQEVVKPAPKRKGGK